MTSRRRLFLIACLAAAACSAEPADVAYRRGVAALEQGRPRVARIELLNAIKADPDNPATRLMQARVYLALRDGAGAEAEIRRARELGQSVDSTRHLLAHAYLLRDRPWQAVEESRGAAPEHAAYAARIRGLALAALGDNEGADKALDEARRLAPGDSATWIAIARFRRGNGDLGEAIAAADKALSFNSKNVEAITLRGELTRSQDGLRAALPWFDRALAVAPDNVPALLERAATLGDMGRMTAMLADTRKVLSLQPGEPMAYYLQAMLAARAHDFRLAKWVYAKTGGAMDSQPAAMLLAGAIDYGTGDWEGAVQRLGRLLEMQPDNREARRLLAAAQWRRGDADAVVATLRPLADRSDADSYTLSLIGNALARRGDGGEAAPYLARAAHPARQSSPAPLGGPVDKAELARLRRTAETRPGDGQAQVALVRALLSAGLGDEALRRARALQRANPGVPDTWLLVGDALGIQGRFADAADAYRKAADIAFTEPVAMRLIEALGRSGQDGAAEQALRLFLKQNPRNVPALLLSASRSMQSADYPRAIAVYEELLRRLGGNDAAMLNNLAWAYAGQGEFDRALPLARRAWALDRANPATTDTLGWILFKNGADRVRGLALLQSAARKAAPRIT